MNELSLHILDVAQNSVTAGAKNIEISICDDAGGMRCLTIEDNGCGMSPEMLARVTSPFATSRKSRRVGLGVPLLKMSAEMSGGSFHIKSEQGKGTRLTAGFEQAHIDCLPLGDMGSTMMLLIQQKPDIRFVYSRQTPHGAFKLDTNELRRELLDVPLDHPDVLAFIQQFVNDNEKELVEVHQ